MTKSETSSSDQNLTDDNIVQESGIESTEPEGTSNSSESIKGFQKSLQAKQEEIKALKEALREKEQAERQKKLAEMGEAERYKAMAEEEAAKRGKLEMQLYVEGQLAGKNIPQAIRDLLIKTPYAIPAVSDELGDTFTWDEAIAAVKRHLPSYIESLVVKDDTKKEEDEPSSSQVDSERSVDSAVVAEHIYTQEEISQITKDPTLYEKHRDRILKQLAKDGGRIPQIS